MNDGKAFERDWKDSTPNNFYIYKIRDPAQSFGPTKITKYSIKNPFDYIMYDHTLLYALELKSTCDTNISFEIPNEYHGTCKIKLHQIEALKTAKSKGLLAGFILNFRSNDKTYFIEISDFTNFAYGTYKISINQNDIVGLRHLVIQQRKKRTRQSYDVKRFTEDCINTYYSEVRNTINFSKS